MEHDERIGIYTIPPNFAEEGTMLSGRIKTRNAIETVSILLVLVPLLISLEITGKAKIYIGMIVLVPVVILSVIGIQGESLCMFIGSFFRFIRRRRCLSMPDEEYRLKQNRIRQKSRKEKRRSREKGKSQKRQQPELEPGEKENQSGDTAGAKKAGNRKKGFPCKQNKSGQTGQSGDVS